MTTDPNPGSDPLDPPPADTHDNRGRVTRSRDQPGSVTWTVYDSDGRAVDRGPGTPPDEPHIVG